MKVSAIITTHNRLDVLPRAVNSVINQTYKDIELIIVSDGSTDGTDEYLSRLVKDVNCKIISYHPGRGGNYARNKGIEKATGEYVAFLDDDDEWMPTKIEKQVEKLDNNVGLVYVGKEIIYVNENISYISKSDVSNSPSKDILYGNFIGSTSAVMVRTSLIRKVGMFDVKLGALQDYDLWIRVCQECLTAIVDEPLLKYYNESRNNQISDNNSLYEKSYEYIYNKYIQLYSRLSKEELVKVELNKLIALAIRGLRNNNSNLSRFYIRKALKLKPNIKFLLFYLVSFFPFKMILKYRSRYK